MRFHSDGPNIPDILLTRSDEGRVVFLCGAGVSVPANMPNFVELTKQVIDFFDPSVDSEIAKAFEPWLSEAKADIKSSSNISLDQIFNLLHIEYGKDEVNELVTKFLSINPSINIGDEHGLIKRISKSARGTPQIVTTNFDRLFEMSGQEVEIHEPPAFPDLSYGSSIEGITYLHGRLQEPDSENHPYVLSSADFGRAYLSEAWATKFMRDLLGRYTVVLLGYQAEDPPIKYLLQGLNHDGKYDRSKLYAFDKGLPEEVEAKWHDRGVTAIAFSDFPILWKSIEAWADRADDPRKWRQSVISKTQQDPKNVAPYERGQVAHILRTARGAKSFSQLEPLPHAEWLCVMDASIRSASSYGGRGSDAEVFDPKLAYGLDDDLEDFSEGSNKSTVSNDDLLIWREGDDIINESHRIGGRCPDGFEKTPSRLSHLIGWMARSIHSPVLAWWLVRQNGIHPRLLGVLEGEIERLNDLHPQARHIFNLILEAHRDPRNRNSQYRDWVDFERQVEKDGWTKHVLRDFRKFVTPRLEIKPPSGMGLYKPPQGGWDELRIGDFGQFKVKFMEHPKGHLGFDVSDEVLPEVFRIIEEQFKVVSGLLRDIDRQIYNFDSPTCYPQRNVEGELFPNEVVEPVNWFIQLFDRMVAKYPELARAHAMTWPISDSLFYGRFKLYAYNKPQLFEAAFVAEQVLALVEDVFWGPSLARELLFLLVDRWHEFSGKYQVLLMERILAGPEKRSYWSDEEYPERQSRLTASYGRYIQLQGGELSVDHAQKLSEVIGKVPEWRDSWAVNTVVKHGASGGFVSTDEDPSSLSELTTSEVVTKAKEISKRDFLSLNDKKPFLGLVKSNPRKALLALIVHAKKGDYPEERWSEMINHFPEQADVRVKRVFLNRLLCLPNPVIVDLRFTLSRWIEKNLSVILQFDEDLSWALFDHIIEGIMSGGGSATASGRGEVMLKGEVVQQSRRTFDHAINGPIGMCAEALFRATKTEKRDANSLLPDYIKSRMERLFSAEGEGSDHAVSVVFWRLSRLMMVDPAWTKGRLIPMLAFDHPAAEPAWNGLLHRSELPCELLLEIIKPQLINLFPWVERFSWSGRLTNIAAEWLGWMRVFRPDEAIGLSQKEMRSVIRSMPESTRNQFIYWLSRLGQHRGNDWNKHVVPLIAEDWPRERQYRTMAASGAWVNLLGETGNSFPDVYAAVKRFLVPINTNNCTLYRFFRETPNQETVTVLFPGRVLDLMSRITPESLGFLSYELPQVLELISEAEPSLTSDSRYLRLIDLVEAS